MKRHSVYLLVGISAVLFASTADAEFVIPDDLYFAMEQAGKSLAQGEERKPIVAKLHKAIHAHPKGEFLKTACSLMVDIDSADKAARKLSFEEKDIRQHPERYLIDTKMPLYLLRFTENQAALERFDSENPGDPIMLLLAQGRSAIPKLLPLLEDCSTTRAYHPTGLADEIPTVPRVCDFAMLLIERLTLCRFHYNASTGDLFHQIPKDKQQAIIQHMQEWWRANGDKSLAEGIKAQLPHAEFYEKAAMAENLIELGRQNGTDDDDEYALQVLREMFDAHRGHTAAHLAQKLAQYGDLTPLDTFYERWEESLRKPGRIYDSHVMFYMTDYGGRREWELLHAVAKKEIERGLPHGEFGVWSQLVLCTKTKTSPWAVPILGFALTRAEPSDSISERAVSLLQQQTGIDFGYQRGGSPEEKLTAIRKALTWWNETGRNGYTFDRIEQRLEDEEKERSP